ncbi:MAG: YdcF family protein [Afipia sp.]|nr:YdcF family protein [Afipia sp.]
MFFVASKIAGFFALPSNIVAALCVAGIAVMMTRHRVAGLRVLVAGIVALLVFGYSPLANVMLLSLSERFPAWQSGGRTPDGIIVLGGAIDSEITEVRHSLEMDSSGERIVAMLQLARQYPSAKIVFTGGSGNLIQASASEAPIIGRLLESFGVARDRVTLEGNSRTTAENAIFTRRLVQPKPGELWLLVTSSFHMPRSIGAFRKAGFDVEAYPVDWRTNGWSDATTPFNKLSAGLARSDVAIHEWTGLIAYWLTGRSSELFPKPR